MNKITIGPNVDPASFTERALIAIAISTATTKIAKSNMVITNKIHPVTDTDGDLTTILIPVGSLLLPEPNEATTE